MIVLDSSFLIAFHNSRDVHHVAAARAMGRFLEGEWGEALLPEYVFLEVTTVLAARRDLRTAVSVGEALLRSSELELVPCAPLLLETLSIFSGQAKRGLSFADAAIVAIARQRGASRVATFDRGFRGLAGLSVVPSRQE